MQTIVKKHDKNTSRAIAEYLAHNSVTHCQPNARAIMPGQIARADQFGVIARGHADQLARATSRDDS